MNTWKQAIITQDVDAIMANYSEDFNSESGESRGETRQMFQYLISAGMLDNIDINFDIAQLTITDDTAEFTPVEILSDMGEMTVDFTLKKEDENTWRIIESDEQQ
jgi:ketosteroid isomerase-like protein